MRAPRTAALIAAAVLAPLASRAEEGGTGHYTPGLAASFIDALPAQSGVSVADFFVIYPASSSAPLPSGGLVATIDSKVFANYIAVVDRTGFSIFGGSYAFGAIVSVVWMDSTATIASLTGNETPSGIGDTLLYPAILGWTALEGALKTDVRLGIYAPTGKFEAGSFANVGKNYWTFEPSAAVSYDGGVVQASAFAGVDFNTRNQTTDYLTGTQVHVDGTVAGRVASLGDGRFGAGASGFWYRQVSGDSGSGATLGGFQGRTAGVGPVVSYATKLSGADGAIELKWLPELSVANRLKGSSFWIKFGAVF